MADLIENGRALVELHLATMIRLEHLMDELRHTDPQMMQHLVTQLGIYVDDHDGDYVWGIDDRIRMTIH